MWKTLHKLTKSLSSLPGPRRVAKTFKGKVDQFKQHVPILSTICNPGIKDRHWEMVSLSFHCHKRNIPSYSGMQFVSILSVQISSIVGFEVKPNEDSTLLDMLMVGLSEYSDRLVQNSWKQVNVVLMFLHVYNV